ncbi:hypothetical protein GCM10010365_67910 [Streptomyces poonensis]|uniref:Uncharacterized protein n=1 Tax=Streptomyces poonensis TaxID=68255 RepID=A0A918UW60_9ACTN|nr:hypothetical protein GCM10010365_67910 [Streptomyces poonensis]GLJ91149.1 hypothetical protein GCM10017589_37550 [Streptomyces poonensis]
MCGASTHSQTTLVHSSAYAQAATPTSRRCRSSTAKDGSTHTRWCTQVIGLTRQEASPVTANAPVQSPARAPRRACHAHTPRTHRTVTAQTARSGSPSRARTPWRDWLET